MPVLYFEEEESHVALKIGTKWRSILSSLLTNIVSEVPSNTK